MAKRAARTSARRSGRQIKSLSKAGSVSRAKIRKAVKASSRKSR